MFGLFRFMSRILLSDFGVADPLPIFICLHMDAASQLDAESGLSRRCM